MVQILLESHRVIRHSPGLLLDADLILVMEKSLKEGMPKEKTYVFNPFLGRKGDIKDPWPDDENEDASMRYNECMKEIRIAVEEGVDKILSYLA